jgi:hypothetical protein
MSTTSFSAIMLLAALAPARAEGPPSEPASPAAAPTPEPAAPAPTPAPSESEGWEYLTAAELAAVHPGSGAGYFRRGAKDDTLHHWGKRSGLKERDPGSELLIVASNGGGDRARFVTLGVYDLMMKTGLWAAVDGLSTVSGSGAAAVAALAATAHLTREADGTLTYGVTPHGTRGIITDHPAQSDLGLMINNASPKKQQKKATEIIVPPFARAWAQIPYLGDERPAGEPLWVPNASTAQAGERVPLTALTATYPAFEPLSAARMLYLSSAVPGIMPPGEVSLEDGGPYDENVGISQRWLVDGASADRWGVITAVELALADWAKAPARATRSVLVVDSRPSPASDGVGATFSGGRWSVRTAARAQLVGYSIEQSRLGTDAIAGEAIFEPAYGRSQTDFRTRFQYWNNPVAWRHTELEALQVLQQEGFDYYPIAYGASNWVGPNDRQVIIQRVGADTLLQPLFWDDPKQTSQCARTAARLYTVIATQPTDFSLRTPMLREGWRSAGENIRTGYTTYTTRFYPYGACTMHNPGKGEGCERDARAAALAMAGGFSLWLQLDFLRTAVSGVVPTDTQAADAEAMWQMWEGLEGYMNWRSWQAYADFAICLQQNGLDGSKVSGHLDAAKGRDSYDGEIGDPLLDSHTLRVPTSFYPEVHPAPCAGAECAAYALPPIVRVKGGSGREAIPWERDAAHPPTERCVDRAEGEGLLKGSSPLRSTLFDEDGSLKLTEKGAPLSNPRSCPW